MYPRGFWALKRRLDRLWEAHQQRLAEEKAEREREETVAGFVASVREGLTRAGIDPETVPAVRRYEERKAEAARAAAHPPPEPPPGPPTGPPPRQDHPLAWLTAKFSRILESHRAYPLDLAQASLAELFAVYCFVPDPAALDGAPSG